MPDKKINELPDESGMTTADTDKLIFIGDPADGKLFHGKKPDRNFANTDLTATGDREHNFNNKSLLINNVLAFQVDGSDKRLTLDNTPSFLIQTNDGTYTAQCGGSTSDVIFFGITETATPSNGTSFVANMAGGDTYARMVTNKGLDATSITITPTTIEIKGIKEFADNTAAIAGGLTLGMLYRTGDVLKIVH